MNRYKTKRKNNKKYNVTYNLYGDKKDSIVFAENSQEAVGKMRNKLKILKINGATDIVAEVVV
jgi:hypothetical protein